MKTLTHFIGGEHVAGTSGRFGDVFNPATGEVQARVPLASRSELRLAVDEAAKIFPQWAGLNPQRRARVMFNFKSLVEQNIDALAHLLSSEHGKIIADHQMVQEAIADSYAEINMLRLLVLWTAWTIDNSSTQEARTQIAACKYTCAKVLREVTYRALHIMGSLGTTNLTPLQAMWASAPTMAIADGVDEVHKVTVARNVLKGYEPHDGLWPTEYIPAKREQAKKKYADLLATDPDYAAWSERAERAMMRGH